MIKAVSNLGEVKKTIGGYKDREVEVTFSLGRNKTATFIGKLTGVYPALFTVSPLEDGYRGKTTYSYSEYMCGKVKIKEIKKSG